MNTKANRIYNMWRKLEYTDQYESFQKELKNCNESDLREAFGDNINALVNIIFAGTGDAFDYVSQDFIREMIPRIDKSDRDWLEDYIGELIYHLADDIYKDEKNTMKYYSPQANWLNKVGNYIKYCNPVDENIRKEYTFIMDQVFYYTYIRD